MSVVMRSHQFQIFDVTRVTLLVKQRTFPIEQKHKPVAIFEPFDVSSTWKDSRIYGH